MSMVSVAWRVYDCSEDILEYVLNRFTSVGWEVYSIFPTPEGKSDYRIVFKTTRVNFPGSNEDEDEEEEEELFNGDPVPSTVQKAKKPTKVQKPNRTPRKRPGRAGNK